MKQLERREDGAALIIAMVIVVVIGLIATGIVGFAGTTQKFTYAASIHSQQLYGADGGIEYGIKILETDSTGTYCPSPASGTMSLPSHTVNGQLVTVTCRTIAGSFGGTAFGPSNYAIVATQYGTPASPAKAIQTEGSTGSASTITITGQDVFNAGGFTFSGGSPQLVIKNNLLQTDASPNTYCTVDKAAAVGSANPSVSGSWTCEPSSVAVPDPQPTVTLPTSAAPPSRAVTCAGGGSGTILFPGKYTSAPTFSDSGRYYLASGVYFLSGTGTVTLKGQVFGGQPQSPETQQLSGVTPCVDDSAANGLVPGSASGSGVEIVLGGNAALDVNNVSASKVELFSRVFTSGTVGTQTQGMSIYQVSCPAANPPPVCASLPANGKSTSSSLFQNLGTAIRLIVHGFVYAPATPVVAWALAGTNSQFASLEAQSIDIKVNAGSGSGVLAGVGATPAARTILITSSASVVERAVVTVNSTLTPPTANVQSWRVCGDSSCET